MRGLVGGVLVLGVLVGFVGSAGADSQSGLIPLHPPPLPAPQVGGSLADAGAAAREYLVERSVFVAPADVGKDGSVTVTGIVVTPSNFTRCRIKLELGGTPPWHVVSMECKP